MDRFEPDLTDPLLACVDIARLGRAAESLGIAERNAPASTLLRLYNENPALAALNVNPFFDEKWYRLDNADVNAAIEEGICRSGLAHFVEYGRFEGRWPDPILKSQARSPDKAGAPCTQPDLDRETYLALNADAQAFLLAFPVMSALQHYNNYGRLLGMILPVAGTASQPGAPQPGTAVYLDLLAAEFDEAFYTERYLRQAGRNVFSTDPFTHYLVYGIPNGASPSAAFDEGWYRAFYPEIRIAIENGAIPCGFYHYIVAGRIEGRLPRYERKEALEARIPGVTRPALLERIPSIRARMQQRRITVSATAAPRVWVLLPTMNPDITFGGYRSAFELMRKLHEGGWRISIVCTEDGQADREYFLWREESEVFRKLAREIEIIGHAEGQSIEVGTADTVLAYSLWDLYAADQIRKAAPATRVVLLAQEFEPIFYDNCAARALAEEAYRIAHYPLINSSFLRRYFEAHRVGVFGAETPAVEGRDFSVFEHRINRLVTQTEAQMRARTERVLVAYARPEGHAARNMFEILVLALQQVCAEGLFGSEWQFIGLGALTELAAVPLGGGHVLSMHPKMSEEEYTGYIRSMDIGISLMFAPHPSVMPFEFATTGAVVVTNTYENRSAEQLAAISGNIVAGRPSIEGISDALRRAASLVGDTARRVRNIYKPPGSSWDTIFETALLQTVFGPPTPERTKLPSVVMNMPPAARRTPSAIRRKASAAE